MIRIVAAWLTASLAFAGPSPATRANAWYARQPGPVGANFLTSNAVNELEMWQAETWSPELIEKELGWARSLGMNTMRVFLRDRAYRRDPAGFNKRLDALRKMASRLGIRPMLVLFDSCWDPQPQAGPQKPPTPGLHNSGRAQSPGRELLEDESKWTPLLRAYVFDVVRSFRATSASSPGMSGTSPTTTTPAATAATISTGSRPTRKRSATGPPSTKGAT